MPFTEVADRIWVARYTWFDVNVTLVGGADGLLVVDTHASGLAAREVVEDVRRLGVGPVVGIVNTHEHFDHTFGNDEFRTSYGAVPIHAHETAAAGTVAAGERIRALYDADRDDPQREEVLATRIVPADHTFSSALTLDLGDRFVELVHPGRGHTGGDLVVRVPDADVLLAGDLVEESAARHAVPGFGGDCYPLEWPWTLDIVLGLTTSASVVVPGHGAPVDRDFVEEQRNAIGIVAENIRTLAAQGVPAEQALAATQWPYPTEELADAVRRGYEQLPRSGKRLPLA
ncbi:MBL fold metallo-hydrolase [Nocardioides lianchengensis]|uniref:Glyoxylase, beta-lactamase superfamily II n=1 Tax=Nocardioides lianchengensis TaxID=1045774 RepID=A0A1G6WVR4_9ACTN|nr:MBL fold metallo-hydrolase [Nocardioides lianchengensis]NYG09184.1 glyoxylase-like metal-dependent hydrolase (beta-lactamase superfamily II) [Nocardioides lianchengensis]SDD69921.1 Glyoxylase, beta-lactamase superfamily II [Nocardioides lianchengensis]